MWYTETVHKPFYASGFLYHSDSQQILLQQLTQGNETNFVLFRAKSVNGHDPQTVFRQCIEEALGITVTASTVYPVYDYVHDRLGEHFIFFAEIMDDTPIKYGQDNTTGWIPIAKLSKYPMSEQTRHDIIIGERVIRSLTEAVAPPPQKRY